MEKQHNRGQDGAGFASIKLECSPVSVISVESVNSQQPIQDIFVKINNRINHVLQSTRNANDVKLRKNIVLILVK